ncbi:MAG: hypothetical protein AAGC93_22020, partial [Cyanobacteria bacterium P01_F01_bin.53]
GDEIDEDASQTSLREAVLWANAQESAVTVILPSGQINLASRGDPAPTEGAASVSDLDIYGDVTLRGQTDGSSSIMVSFDGTGNTGPISTYAGAFQVHDGAALTLQTMTLETQSTLNRSGGAVYNQGELTLSETEVRGFNITGSRLVNDRIERVGKINLIGEQSSSPNLGGAIFNDAGSVDISSSTFSENVAGLGGAIASVGGFDVTLDSHEDWDYYLRLAQEWEFAVVNEPQILYRKSANSLSSRLPILEKYIFILHNRVFGEISPELEYLEAHSKAKKYEFLTQIALTNVSSWANCLYAMRSLTKAIAHYPAILFTRRIPILITKLIIAIGCTPLFANQALMFLLSLRAKQYMSRPGQDIQAVTP